MHSLIPHIPEWYLMIAGLIIIAVEIFFLNLFVILWFGLACLVMGILGFALPNVIGLLHGEWQLLGIALIGIVSLFSYKIFFSKATAADNTQLDQFQTGKIGTVVHTESGLKVSYQGTLWAIAPGGEVVTANQQVCVQAIRNNQVVISTVAQALPPE